MFPALASWDLASLVTKYAWYMAVICVAGGSFSLWLTGDNSRRFLTRNLFYILTGSIIGFHGVLLYFLVQVGVANGQGLAGMFDWNMISFFLETGIGEASLFRIAVLLILIIGQLVALGYLGRLQRPPGQMFYRIIYRFNGAGLLVLCLSLQSTGHVAPLPLAPRIALVIHVLAVSLWIGTLYPLRRVTQDYELEQVQFVMRRFGNWAFAVVAWLLAAAVLVVFHLLTNLSEFVESAYGISLLVKILLVGGLLLLAALNRWRLVPHLLETGYLQKLRTSITAEMICAALILLITVYLSTVIGPDQM